MQMLNNGVKENPDGDGFNIGQETGRGSTSSKYFRWVCVPLRELIGGEEPPSPFSRIRSHSKV